MVINIGTPAISSHHRCAAAVDTDELARTVARDTLSICRQAPKGTRSAAAIQLGKDLTRTDRGAS